MSQPIKDKEEEARRDAGMAILRAASAYDNDAQVILKMLAGVMFSVVAFVLDNSKDIADKKAIIVSLGREILHLKDYAAEALEEIERQKDLN